MFFGHNNWKWEIISPNVAPSIMRNAIMISMLLICVFFVSKVVSKTMFLIGFVNLKKVYELDIWLRPTLG